MEGETQSLGGGASGGRPGQGKAPWPFGSDKHRIVVTPVVSLIRYGWHTEYIPRPVFIGCATKNAKVVIIAIGSLNASSPCAHRLPSL